MTDFELIVADDEVEELVEHKNLVNGLSTITRRLTVDFPDPVMPITLLRALDVRVTSLGNNICGTYAMMPSSRLSAGMVH